MLERETLVNSIQGKLKEFNYSSLRQLNHPLLEPEEYNSLAHYSQKNDVVCQDLLFACSGRLIHSVVSNYINDNEDPSWTYDDLMQSGYLGISYALDDWKEELGIFTSYSMWHIQNQIREQIHTLGNMIFIRDPHRAKLASQLPHLRDLCESEYGQEVSNVVLAKWINKEGYSRNVKNGNINSQDIFRMDEIRVSDSLDQNIKRHFSESVKSENSLLDTIIDHEHPSPLIELIEKEAQKGKRYLARRLMESLTEKQKIVVELYYGFDSEATCSKTGKSTFDSVAKVLERRRNESWDKFKTQQLHTRALKRMKELALVFRNGLDYKYV